MSFVKHDNIDLSDWLTRGRGHQNKLFTHHYSVSHIHYINRSICDIYTACINFYTMYIFSKQVSKLYNTKYVYMWHIHMYMRVTPLYRNIYNLLPYILIIHSYIINRSYMNIKNLLFWIWYILNYTVINYLMLNISIKLLI